MGHQVCWGGMGILVYRSSPWLLAISVFLAHYFLRTIFSVPPSLPWSDDMTFVCLSSDSFNSTNWSIRIFGCIGVLGEELTLPLAFSWFSLQRGLAQSTSLRYWWSWVRYDRYTPVCTREKKNTKKTHQKRTHRFGWLHDLVKCTHTHSSWAPCTVSVPLLFVISVIGQKFRILQFNRFFSNLA